MAKCIVLAAIAMLVAACVASPLSKDDKPVNTKATAGLPERPSHKPENLLSRVRRSLQIPEDQRELMSRQLLQALSEIVQREDCVSDYQGWVDFGRRSAN